MSATVMGDQLRSAARYGTPLRAESLNEMAMAVDAMAEALKVARQQILVLSNAAQFSPPVATIDKIDAARRLAEAA